MEQERTRRTRGRQRSPLRLLLCLLSTCSFLLPVAGFSLKNCRITTGISVICTNNKLRAVPEDIPSSVRHLDLSQNRISKIHGSNFKDLRALTNLDLKHNKIAAIDKGAFAHLSSLQVLNLNNNHLVKLQDDLFVGLSNLTMLRLVNNNIKTVESSSFKALASLKVLDLANNKLSRLASVRLIVQHLPNLKELRIKANSLHSFQSWELSNNSMQLTSLDLSLNPIQVFRLTANIFPNLTRLNLGYMVTKDPVIWEVGNETWLGRVSRLEISGLRLSAGDTRALLGGVNSSLSYLRINAMKSDLAALIQLACTIPTMSTLQLRNNHLKVVTPDLLRLCVNVTEVDLGDNLVRNISDDSFRALKRLKILTLKRNKLPSVPAATRNLPTLLELDLSSNNISALGCHDFANLTKLRELSLSQNSIWALTECLFKDLTQLQVLKLQINRISRLNGAFKHYLPNLRSLHLNNNKLTAIAKAEFASLGSLQNLSLHENQIKKLKDEAFVGLSSLTSMRLQSNEIESSELRSNVFSGLTNLRQLDLSENHIKYRTNAALPDPPFSELSRLETLLILSQHRRLRAQLPQNLLLGLSNLSFFTIRNVQLLSLHVNTFDHTPQLKTLDVSSNELTDISPALFLPLEGLQNLYISRTSLRSLDFLINANLTRLRFLQARFNTFSVISEEVMQFVPELVYLDLQGNSFTCDCDNAWFLQWVEDNNQTQVNDAYELECNYPNDLKGMKLLDLDVRSCSVDTSFMCFISTTCTILLFLATSLTYHFLRWHLVYAYYLLLALLTDTKQRNKQARNQYDAFVSYNIHDEPWVLRELLPKLEGEQGWRLCLHHRDFQPGKSGIIRHASESKSKWRYLIRK